MSDHAIAGIRTAHWWRDQRVRGIIFQIVILSAILAFAAYIINNTATNLASRGIASGFEFLGRQAGFDISITLIPYTVESSYGRVFWVGLVNTLVLSAVGILFATIWGFIIGILRLSPNWIVRKIATVYLETIRNIPLPLQIVFWYFGVLSALPLVRNAIDIDGTFFLHNRGISFPRLVTEPAFGAVPLAFLAAVAATWIVRRWAKRRQEKTGEPFPVFWVGLGLIVGAPVIATIVTGQPWTWEYPELKGFNFRGGWVILPEFIAVLLALVAYTAAFIGEIVRAGIQSVNHGQTEAAFSLGLRPGATLRLVTIPQAMRVIVPPLTSQYLNLMKNSTLGVLVGYPDLVNVFAGTVLNQTGQAVECLLITMFVYLTLSLLISGFMNWYNKRIALKER
ncbi:MAG: amino acid ABC transporter permease [Dongiaceae bacterium]